MTKAEKAKAIIGLVRKYETRIREEAKNARAVYAGTEASHECWEREPDQDPFGHNPYNVNGALAVMNHAEALEADAKEILDFATDHFLSMIPNA